MANDTKIQFPAVRSKAPSCVFSQEIWILRAEPVTWRKWPGSALGWGWGARRVLEQEEEDSHQSLSHQGTALLSGRWAQSEDAWSIVFKDQFQRDCCFASHDT